MSRKLRTAENPRQSESPKAKNQQKCRRKLGLTLKAHKYGMYCNADVYLVVRNRKNGDIFSYTSDDGWSPSMQELVCPDCC